MNRGDLGLSLVVFLLIELWQLTAKNLGRRRQLRLEFVYLIRCLHHFHGQVTDLVFRFSGIQLPLEIADFLPEANGLLLRFGGHVIGQLRLHHFNMLIKPLPLLRGRVFQLLFEVDTAVQQVLHFPLEASIFL